MARRRQARVFPTEFCNLFQQQSFTEVRQQQPSETEAEEEEGGREERDGQPRKGRMVVAFWHGRWSAWSLHPVQNAFGTRKDLAILHLPTPSCVQFFLRLTSILLESNLPTDALYSFSAVTFPFCFSSSPPLCFFPCISLLHVERESDSE